MANLRQATDSDVVAHDVKSSEPTADFFDVYSTYNTGGEGREQVRLC